MAAAAAVGATAGSSQYDRIESQTERVQAGSPMGIGLLVCMGPGGLEPPVPREWARTYEGIDITLRSSFNPQSQVREAVLSGWEQAVDHLRIGKTSAVFSFRQRTFCSIGASEADLQQPTFDPAALSLRHGLVP